MVSFYTKQPERSAPQGQQGVSYAGPITAAKEAVTVLQLAERLVGPEELRRKGDTWVALCPLPDHEEKTPSFTVYSDERGWYCYGCSRGGDVVDLYAQAKGYEHMGQAAGYLLLEFDHELPQRPPGWFRKQERQKPMRDLIREAKIEAFTRRLRGAVFEPIVNTIEDPKERERMIDELWHRVWTRAALIVDGDQAREERA